VLLQKQPVGHVDGNVAALLTYGQKLPRGQGLHTVSSAEQEVKSTEEFKKKPAGQLQLTLVLMA